MRTVAVIGAVAQASLSGFPVASSVLTPPLHELPMPTPCLHSPPPKVPAPAERTTTCQLPCCQPQSSEPSQTPVPADTCHLLTTMPAHPCASLNVLTGSGFPRDPAHVKVIKTMAGPCFPDFLSRNSSFPLQTPTMFSAPNSLASSSQRGRASKVDRLVTSNTRRQPWASL